MRQNETRTRFLPANQEAEAAVEELIRTLTEAQEEQASAMITADPEDVTDLLRPSGTMRFFQKSAVWDTDGRTEAMDQLYAELAQVSAAARSEYGDSLRILLQIDLCTSAGLEEVERCAHALTAGADPESPVVFQVRIQNGTPDGFFGVRGLVGAWETGQPA